MNSYANCTPWGNVIGMRIDGELLDFETSLRLVEVDWCGFTQSSKYNWEDPIEFTREENKHHCVHALKDMPVTYRMETEDSGPGEVKVTLTAQVGADIPAAGLFFCVELPASKFSGASVVRMNADRQGEPMILEGKPPAGSEIYFQDRISSVRVLASGVQVEILPSQACQVLLRQDFVHHPAYLNDPIPRVKIVGDDPRQPAADYQVYFTLASENLHAGQTVEQSFILRGQVEMTPQPVFLALDVSRPGKRFDGISGNFRLQFPEHDPMVIEYCLENLRISWGRIAMWWRNWHPDEMVDPVKEAKEGRLNERVQAQMELARELARRNIPVIVSAWDPPRWAVDPSLRSERGYHLDEKKMEQIGASIAGYLEYLKEIYGVEAAMFSFNETDVGVEVKQTPEEHALYTKSLGWYFARRGLATKLLLGDTGHGTAAANRLVGPAVAEVETHEYIGAVAFHTWHGCTSEDLAAWLQSAQALNVPLMAIESGPDSAAHRYPAVFIEPWFELLQIDLHIRICAQSQPSTIMEWQFTSDYSVLTGMGIYGTQGPLRPTQRFWNFKQLGSTPVGAFALPISCDRAEVSCAAFGNIARGEYVVHLVNNGGRRRGFLSGIPASVREMRVFTTDANRGMHEGESLVVVDGQVIFDLEAASFTSLFGTIPSTLS